MTYKANDKDWEVLGDYIEKAIRDPDTVPDKLIILPVSSREISSIMTNKRIELINTIKENRNSLIITQLSQLLDRKESAIQRDLSLLEHYSIIQIKKKGRATVPQVFAESIVFPLESKTPRDIGELIEQRERHPTKYYVDVGDITTDEITTAYTSFDNQPITIDDGFWVESLKEVDKRGHNLTRYSRTENEVSSSSCSILVQ